MTPSRLGNGQIVDARFATLHETGRRKLPELIPIGAIPLAVAIMPLILELHRHTIVPEAPELLLELVVQLPSSFTLQEFYDCGAASQKFGSIPPLSILGICSGYTLRIASVPEVFRDLDFPDCEFRVCKRRAMMVLMEESFPCRV